MLQHLGREPTLQELAAELDMTTENVAELQKYGVPAPVPSADDPPPLR
jgi:DNA-directed RNA polymerase specialized sigma subunit